MNLSQTQSFFFFGNGEDVHPRQAAAIGDSELNIMCVGTTVSFFCFLLQPMLLLGLEALEQRGTVLLASAAGE